ncbi:MAG: TonB-dependent receptor plug domain-containing protein, partial [Pseudomonadota bacterium]
MKKGSKLSAISVCTCIAFAGNVNAEDTAEEQQLERVSIVGSKVNRTRQELSNSIGFFGEYRLQNDNIFSVEDIFDRTANTFTGTTGFGSYSIRGVNNNGIVSGISNANALSSIVLNQVALGVNSGDYIKPGLFDAQSVEIFRGPQSTVQGPNSLIGAIYINFAKPEFDQGFEGKARVQAGQLDTLNAAVAQNLVLVDDYLAARISFETRQTDGDVVNTTTGRDDVQRLDENALRLGIKAQPFGDESLVFDLTYFNVDSDSNPFGLVSNETGDLFDRIQVVDVDDEY